MNIKNIFLAISISFGIFSCGSSNAEEAKISLPTIMCGMCETNIKDAFTSTDGILKVNVDLDSKSGQVFYDSEKVSLAQFLSGAGPLFANITIGGSDATPLKKL